MNYRLTGKLVLPLRPPARSVSARELDAVLFEES
jgi:hypothetical protein